MELPTVEQIATIGTLLGVALGAFFKLWSQAKTQLHELKGPDNEPTMREMLKSIGESVGVIEARLDSQDRRLFVLEARK